MDKSQQVDPALYGARLVTAAMECIGGSTYNGHTIMTAKVTAMRVCSDIVVAVEPFRRGARCCCSIESIADEITKEENAAVVRQVGRQASIFAQLIVVMSKLLHGEDYARCEAAGAVATVQRLSGGGVIATIENPWGIRNKTDDKVKVESAAVKADNATTRPESITDHPLCMSRGYAMPTH